MSTKLKCVLLDDELPGLTYLKMLCEQISEVEVVKVFNDPQKFLESSNAIDFDACIIDIEMPKISGMQIAQTLKSKQVIFVTAHKHYAADAFDLDATDFIGKPITKERLEVAIGKAQAKQKMKEQQRQILQLNTDKGKALIDVADIAYITTSEIDSRDKIAVMLDQSTLVLKNVSFETLQAQLPGGFCRVNKKQIIALKIVSSYTHNEITTSLSGESGVITINLNETYRQPFLMAAKGIS